MQMKKKSVTVFIVYILSLYVFCWTFSCRLNNFNRRLPQLNCKSLMTVLDEQIKYLKNENKLQQSPLVQNKWQQN